MRTAVLVFSALLLYLLHQDVWFWRDGRLVFGVVPIGLFYHAVYAVACSGFMWLLVRFSWPADAETDQQPTTSNQQPS